MSALTTVVSEGIATREEHPRERLGRLFDLHHLRLYRFALRMTRGADEALDLVQEAFVRAAKDVQRLPGDDDGARAWLVRVIVNLLHDRHRRETVRNAFRIGYVPPAQHDFARAIEARDAVHAAIALLPPRQRAIVVLYELEERGIAEIAAELGVTAVNVRWHLHAGRKRLSKLLAPLQESRT